MRQRIKSVLRRLWRLASPLRRPIVRKFDAYLVERLQRQIKPLAQVVAEQLVQLRELNLCAENTIRELIRLQMQLEAGQLAADPSAGQTQQDWTVIAPEAASGNSSQAA